MQPSFQIQPSKFVDFQSHKIGTGLGLLLVMTKTDKLLRKIDLANAQTFAALGQVEAARALFAKHGVAYVPAVRS